MRRFKITYMIIRRRHLNATTEPTGGRMEHLDKLYRLKLYDQFVELYQLMYLASCVLTKLRLKRGLLDRWRSGELIVRLLS